MRMLAATLLSKIDPTGLLNEGGKDPPPGGRDGVCRLRRQLPVVPTPEVAALTGGAIFLFTLCIYDCHDGECPPNKWTEAYFSTWIWGCQDDRAPGGGTRGREGPRRN
jgi:hypothetical protein